MYTINSIMYFELDNDDMELSKRRSIFISLIFILNCFTKPFVIRRYNSIKFSDTSIFSKDIRTDQILLGVKNISLDSLYTLQVAKKCVSKAFGLICSLGPLSPPPRGGGTRYIPGWGGAARPLIP